jgi:hypothetical protein
MIDCSAVIRPEGRLTRSLGSGPESELASGCCAHMFRLKITNNAATFFIWLCLRASQCCGQEKQGRCDPEHRKLCGCHSKMRTSVMKRTPMTTKSKSRKPRSPKPAQPSDIEESVRRRAYELYEQRGRIEGFALDDWLQAEREILGPQKQRKVKAARGSQC